MNVRRSSVARWFAVVALSLSIGSYAAPQIASAATLSASVTSQAEPQQFNPPAAPGEESAPTSSGAVESAEPVEGAPGETGIQAEVEGQRAP